MVTGIANWLAAERLPKHKHTACKLIEFFRSKITSCSASLLRLKALKSPRAKMDKAQLRFQGWNEVCISGSTKSEKEGGEIWRWKKQIFERKITVTAAQSRDVEKTE